MPSFREEPDHAPFALAPRRRRAPGPSRHGVRRECTDALGRRFESQSRLVADQPPPASPLGHDLPRGALLAAGRGAEQRLGHQPRPGARRERLRPHRRHGACTEVSAPQDSRRGVRRGARVPRPAPPWEAAAGRWRSSGGRRSGRRASCLSRPRLRGRERPEAERQLLAPPFVLALQARSLVAVRFRVLGQADLAAPAAGVLAASRRNNCSRCRK